MCWLPLVVGWASNGPDPPPHPQSMVIPVDITSTFSTTGWTFGNYSTVTGAAAGHAAPVINARNDTSGTRAVGYSTNARVFPVMCGNHVRAESCRHVKPDCLFLPTCSPLAGTMHAAFGHMVYFLLAHTFTFVLDLVTTVRRSDRQKDLEILLLRQQLRILHRKHALC